MASRAVRPNGIAQYKAVALDGQNHLAGVVFHTFFARRFTKELFRPGFCQRQVIHAAELQVVLGKRLLFAFNPVAFGRGLSARRGRFRLIAAARRLHAHHRVQIAFHIVRRDKIIQAIGPYAGHRAVFKRVDKPCVGVAAFTRAHVDSALHGADFLALALCPAPVRRAGQIVQAVERGEGTVSQQAGVLPAVAIQYHLRRAAQHDAARRGIALPRHGNALEDTLFIQYGLIVVEGREAVQKSVAILGMGFLAHRGVHGLFLGAVAQHLRNPCI